MSDHIQQYLAELEVDILALKKRLNAVSESVAAIIREPHLPAGHEARLEALERKVDFVRDTVATLLPSRRENVEEPT